MQTGQYKCRALGRRDEEILYGGTKYLWVLRTGGTCVMSLSWRLQFAVGLLKCFKNLRLSPFKY